MSHSEHEFRQMDQAMERTLVSHAESVKQAIENGRCVKCQASLRTEVGDRAIKFVCEPPCGWFAIYPIRTIGNSERALRDESLNLVAIAECEVLDAAKAWAEKVNSLDVTVTLSESSDLLAAVTLLESRKQDAVGIAERF